MPGPRHIVLASIGTDGDVNPFLGLGRSLRARGYRVTLATHEHFAQAARDADLEFRVLVSNQETEELLENRHFWHPLRGPIIVARWSARLLHRQYEVLREFASDAGTLLIASPGVVAARLAQEKFGVPLVSIILQPWLIPSLHAPPYMMGGLTLPAWAPRFAGRAYYYLFDQMGAFLLGNTVNHLRASLGLPPVRRMFRWWLSPTLVLALFPDWYAQPQADWSLHLQLTGFPFADGPSAATVPAAVRQFCADGAPPVLFTFGTGMMHAREVFRESVEACRSLGLRGIFLTRFRAQVPGELPPSMIHCEFAPFQQLFPLCATIVHHGGIGTTAKAFAAGVPQLILPFAFDQMDNALRTKRLGVGEWLGSRQRQAASLARALSTLLRPEAPSVREPLPRAWPDTKVWR